jgi:hypothetical protein
MTDSPALVASILFAIALAVIAVDAWNRRR